MRLAAAPPVPDLSDRIVAAAVLPRRERWGARVALAIVALAQAGLGFGQLLGTSATHAGHAGVGAVHLGNESAAWNLAVGIGLLWAALRPASSGGLLPALTGFTLVLGAVSASDLFGGAVTAGRVLSHGIMLAGLCLLFVVHRQNRATAGPAPSHAAPEPELEDQAPVYGNLARLFTPGAGIARRATGHDQDRSRSASPAA
ncbi:hypothetical protein ABZ863_22730 [Saccharomonospora sp. NPDC046836]|uniref:hypothetical protein n=1 Tax=Saccharomonospora sp. NPDC046836 TaxID=3156921 RepID=UPI00340C963B